MHRGARTAAVAIAAVLLAGACSSGRSDSSGSGATVPPSTTTTDPYAVPAVIDIAYLNRVFVALEKINGDATRLIVANRFITPDAARLLGSILTKEEFEIQAEGWNKDIDKGLTNFRPDPGDRRTTVRRIVVSRADCVGLEVDRDYSAVTSDAKSGATALVSLARGSVKPPNPTPWLISSQLLSGHLPCE